MNGYICFYKSQRVEVEANTTREAQQLAAKALKVPLSKEYLITPMLAEKDGKPVTHSTSSL